MVGNFPVIERSESEVLDMYYQLLRIQGIIKHHLADKERLFLVEATKCLFMNYIIGDTNSRNYLLNNGFSRASLITYKGILEEKGIIHEIGIDTSSPHRTLLLRLDDSLIGPFKTENGYQMPKLITYAFSLKSTG